MPVYDPNPQPVGRRPPRPPMRPPKRPPPPKKATIPGHKPDYAALIKGSSRYQGWLGGATKRRGDLASDRRAALRDLILQFGLQGSVQDVYGDLDPDLLRLAGESKVSRQALLNKAYADQVASRKRGLVSRGMSDSGESGYEDTQAADWRAQEEYNLGNQLAQMARDILGGYTTGMSDIDQQEQDILTDPALLEQIRTENPATADEEAMLIPGSASEPGGPTYVTKGGRKFKMGPNGPYEVTDRLKALGRARPVVAGMMRGNRPAPGGGPVRPRPPRRWA